MLCCKSNFKENVELLVRVAWGKIYMSDTVFVLLLMLSFVKIFTLPVSQSWFTWCIFTAFWWKLHILHNVWNTYTFYTNGFIHIYVCTYLHRERKEEKETMHVTKGKIISFSALCNGNNRNIFYSEVWKNIFFQLLMSQLAVFCEWMSKLDRTIGNSNSYYKPPHAKTHGWKILFD